MESPNLPVPENPDSGETLDIKEVTNTSPSKIPKSTETKIRTNNMEPELVDGFRQVALHRFVGMDRPFYTENEDKEMRMDASHAFKHYEGVLKDKKEEWKTIIEKTPQQKEICRMILKELPGFLKEFGLEKPVQIPESAIQIFDMSSWSKEAREKAKKTPATWSTGAQLVRFNGDTAEGMSKLKFAAILVHELIHAQSFESLVVYERVDEEDAIKRTAEGRRSGFVNYSLEKNSQGKEVSVDNFAQLNEAVTESLAQHFMYKFLYKIPHLEADIEQINKELKEKYDAEKAKDPDINIYVEDNVTGLNYGDEYSEDMKRLIIDSGSYWDEINRYKRATKAILKKAKKYQEQYVQTAETTEKGSLHNVLMGFNEEDDVVKFFSRAYFSGKQLDMARLIKYTTGKGFREFGESTNFQKTRNPEDFE